jgi:transglutaminase-like putative cysteine protease
VDLYRVTDPAPDTVWHFRRSVLFDRYAVETDITTEAVPYEYERSETFLRRYTQPNVLLPVDGPVVQETAAALLRTARNPYVLAFRTYEWVLGNLDPVDQVGAVGAEQALSTGRANAHGYAMATVSLLRAMEIPARPVGGFLVLDDGSIRRHYWGEFYLEDFGWVPLDPAAADGAVPGAFRRPEDPAGYYFGNLDARRFDFTKGVIAIPRMHPEGRTRRLETAYSLQSHHEEAVGDISWYRSLWHDVEYLGEY